MARIYYKTGRKEWTCNKCGKVIPIGEEYKSFTPYKQSTRRYHKRCEIPYSHTTNSDYKISVNDAYEELIAMAEDINNIEDEQTYQEIYETFNEHAEELKDELLDEQQDRLDNMPEQLQDGSIVQERVEALEEIEIDTSLCDEEDSETYYDTMISSADQFLNARDV